MLKGWMPSGCSCWSSRSLSQIVLLRCLRDVLQARAGGERPLPPEAGRLAAVQGCRDVLRDVLDEVWNVCVGVLRDAQMDPYCLPLRLHGRVRPCGPRWGELPSSSTEDVAVSLVADVSDGLGVSPELPARDGVGVSPDLRARDIRQRSRSPRRDGRPSVEDGRDGCLSDGGSNMLGDE